MTVAVSRRSNAITSFDSPSSQADAASLDPTAALRLFPQRYEDSHDLRRQRLRCALRSFLSLPAAWARLNLAAELCRENLNDTDRVRALNLVRQIPTDQIASFGDALHCVPSWAGFHATIHFGQALLNVDPTSRMSVTEAVLDMTAGQQRTQYTVIWGSPGVNVFNGASLVPILARVPAAQRSTLACQVAALSAADAHERSRAAALAVLLRRPALQDPAIWELLQDVRTSRPASLLELLASAQDAGRLSMWREHALVRKFARQPPEDVPRLAKILAKDPKVLQPAFWHALNKNMGLLGGPFLAEEAVYVWSKASAALVAKLATVAIPDVNHLRVLVTVSEALVDPLLAASRKVGLYDVAQKATVTALAHIARRNVAELDHYVHALEELRLIKPPDGDVEKAGVALLQLPFAELDEFLALARVRRVASIAGPKLRAHEVQALLNEYRYGLAAAARRLVGTFNTALDTIWRGLGT